MSDWAVLIRSRICFRLSGNGGTLDDDLAPVYWYGLPNEMTECPFSALKVKLSRSVFSSCASV